MAATSDPAADTFNARLRQSIKCHGFCSALYGCARVFRRAEAPPAAVVTVPAFTRCVFELVTKAARLGIKSGATHGFAR